MKKYTYIILGITFAGGCLAQDSKIDQGSPVYLEIDMARKQDYAKIDEFFNSLKLCQTNLLKIHYAFSQVKFSQNNVSCDVLVEVSGELSETEKPDKYLCKMNALKKINWLQPDVPLTDLQNAKECKHIED